MVLGPRRTQACPRAAKHFVYSITQDAGGRVFDVLGVVEMDCPATLASEVGQYPAVHDGVSAALVWHLSLDGDVLWEVIRPTPNRQRHHRLGQRRYETVQRGRRGPECCRSYVRDQLRQSGVVEGL
jgi:hypothetical protein